MLPILFKGLGGLGLFLFGMKIMSEGLQKVAGNKMRRILQTVSNNRVIGCCVGAAITSVIQSSSATTVMLVGFVDSGLMTLYQAVGVMLGANIGTTVTAQLIAFKIQDYALPAIAIGVFFKFFIKKRNWKYTGDVLLGFGILFYGLGTMKSGFAPLKDNGLFLSLTYFSADSFTGILLCILTGTIVTMILQSSSATVGITMVLASQGILSLDTSVALILGDNIGTTITAQLASIGSSIDAHRTSLAHTLFNVIGVIIIVISFPYFLKLVHFVTVSIMGFGHPEIIMKGEEINASRFIANSHTLFNVINAVIFLFFLPQVVKAAIFLTPGMDVKYDINNFHHIKYLDSKFIDTPSVALALARGEIMRMGEVVKAMYEDVIQVLGNQKHMEIFGWKKRENALDSFQREITRFLVRVTQRSISPEESREVRSLLRMVNNMERIGDAIENIAEWIEKLIQDNLILSEEGLSDYITISNEVRSFLEITLSAAKNEDQTIMDMALEIENRINKMEERMKERHLIRLQEGICAIDPGLIFVNILTAFERMGGFCFNIAQAVAGIK